MDNRERVIIRTSLVGVGANLLLAAFKAAVGLLSHSIAVVLDAVNNLSDALSAVITIIGTRIASRKADKNHPLGHGRVEYLTALLVSALVLYAGITSLVESVKKILHPEEASYSMVSLLIIAVAIAVKLLLGQYVKGTGKKGNSDALVASGQDALSDALVSASVLLTAILFKLTGISLEAYVGVLIACIIIKAGYEMMSETLSEILGKRMDRELVNGIKKTICEDPQVFGAYDLFLHSYGPERLIGSVHVEVEDTLTADEIDLMERRVAERVLKEHGVLLAGIGIYSRNTKNDALQKMQMKIRKTVMAHDGVLQMHGFYADEQKKIVTFDLILDFEVKDRPALFAEIKKEVETLYPDYTFKMTMDIDI